MFTYNHSTYAYFVSGYNPSSHFSLFPVETLSGRQQWWVIPEGFRSIIAQPNPSSDNVRHTELYDGNKRISEARAVEWTYLISHDCLWTIFESLQSADYILRRPYTDLRLIMLGRSCLPVGLNIVIMWLIGLLLYYLKIGRWIQPNLITLKISWSVCLSLLRWH